MHRLKTSMIERINHGQRQLTFHHIISSGFADFLRVEIIEDIITYLEHHTQILTELSCLNNLLSRGTNRESANGTTGFKQGSCLLFDYLIVDFLTDFLILYIRQLEYFTCS